eukprot:Unigene7176_Nuclearia_a/m.22022 Unigene7176_Nuclearia_a/g.22022  ORF Unigene7176_Nuclearia_a/g.22022 Unigene7176_Nuclearia_a/m.22022 type:complete len:322 (-) Unigene7176_Nuclearia_a:49-1014(-)
MARLVGDLVVALVVWRDDDVVVLLDLCLERRRVGVVRVAPDEEAHGNVAALDLRVEHPRVAHGEAVDDVARAAHDADEEAHGAVARERGLHVGAVLNALEQLAGGDALGRGVEDDNTVDHEARAGAVGLGADGEREGGIWVIDMLVLGHGAPVDRDFVGVLLDVEREDGVGTVARKHLQRELGAPDAAGLLVDDDAVLVWAHVDVHEHVLRRADDLDDERAVQPPVHLHGRALAQARAQRELGRVGQGPVVDVRELVGCGRRRGRARRRQHGLVLVEQPVQQLLVRREPRREAPVLAAVVRVARVRVLAVRRARCVGVRRL